MLIYYLFLLFDLVNIFTYDNNVNVFFFSHALQDTLV